MQVGAKHFVKAAHDKYHVDGECEIDQPTKSQKPSEFLSETSITAIKANGGVYVRAWVWVSNEEALHATAT